MGDDDSNDFLDSLEDLGVGLAGVAAKAGATVITNDITGSNLSPTAVLAQQNAVAAQKNSQLILWLIIGFVAYKYFA